VWATQKLRYYLKGYKFVVITDHLALKWLNSINNPTGRIPRWALELQQYQHCRRSPLPATSWNAPVTLGTQVPLQMDTKDAGASPPWPD